MKLKTAAEKIKSGEITSEHLVSESLKKIEETKNLHAYLDVFAESAMQRAREIDKRREKGDSLGPLAGVPLAVKDIIATLEGKTTCGSKILGEFQSIYDASVMEKLRAAGAVIIGKTNLDEFAMGSSTENSAFGRTLNPLDHARICGGSSGGSAAAVSAGTVAAALGSDTGGSIRQPAACCGVVGIKPTYGRVSRYGLVAFASSLDQIGVLSTTVEDSAVMLNVICGADERDQTSASVSVPDFTALLGQGVKGRVIGIPREYFGEGLDPAIRKSLENTLGQLEKEGASLRDISLPHMDYGVAAYYIIATAEASSNLSRYDGVRYTRRAADARNIVELYTKSRAEGFGKEVKRRIMLGTYVLSAGFYDAYYLQAQKVRRKITDDFNAAFKHCDVIATPAMPSLPVEAGKFEQDPLAAYLGDVYTVSLNMAGLPGISVPLEPIGRLRSAMQLIGKPFGEQELLGTAAAVEMLGAYRIDKS